jgi:subtilisin family serine protease
MGLKMRFTFYLAIAIVATTQIIGCSAGDSSTSNNPAPTPTPTPSNSDPLLAYQWSIQNVGASAFSSDLPVAGNDMNVMAAWAAGYTGKGIKVAVVDSGLEIEHEDLAANVDIANSYNFANGSNDPTPTFVGADHGTSVAGIIGAEAGNKKEYRRIWQSFT